MIQCIFRRNACLACCNEGLQCATFYVSKKTVNFNFQILLFPIIIFLKYILNAQVNYLKVSGKIAAIVHSKFKFNSKVPRVVKSPFIQSSTKANPDKTVEILDNSGILYLNYQPSGVRRRFTN